MAWQPSIRPHSERPTTLRREQAPDNFDQAALGRAVSGVLNKTLRERCVRLTLPLRPTAASNSLLTDTEQFQTSAPLTCSVLEVSVEISRPMWVAPDKGVARLAHVAFLKC